MLSNRSTVVCSHISVYWFVLLMVCLGSLWLGEKSWAESTVSSVQLRIILDEASSGIPDSDSDLISDIWELLTFGHLSIATATTDFDEDGVTDYSEYIAGTDAIDPLSVLQITSITPLPNGLLRISWDASDSTYPAPRSYDLFYSTNAYGLSSAPMILSADIPSAGATNITINNISAASSNSLFYGVNVKLDE